MGEHNAKSTDSDKGMVVGDNKKSAVLIKGSGSQRSGNKRKLWIGVLAVVLIAAAPFAYMYTKQVGLFSKDSISVKPEIDPNATPEEVNAAVTAAREKELEQLVADENDAEKKREYQQELVLLYLQQNKKDKAEQLATELEASSQTAQAAAVLADTYFAQGDYEQAAKYYGIAMERSPKPSSPTERVPYNDYANLKKQAEAEAAQ